jgi:methyl-accepting chemotaxis protein
VAENIRKEGEHGIVAVQQVIRSMGEIREQVNTISQTILMLSERTQQIGNITTVIANLTQQSKMLALNASIEAAKAGDAGKGFAVVAAEVRDLAEQSQQSTEQVHKILRDIQLATDRAVMATEQGTKGVDHGEELVKNTGAIMEKLNRVINESVIASQQIVAAVRQEGAGISQVAIAMNEINKVTAQFVGAAEQSKTVSSDLAVISKQLQQSISVYKNV